MKVTLRQNSGLISAKLDVTDNVKADLIKRNSGLIAATLSSPTTVRAKEYGYMGPQGPEGTPGAGIEWLGDYSPTTEYSLSNAVAWNGGSYIFISETPVTGVQPSDEAYWDVLVEPGVGAGGDYVRPTPMSISVGGAVAGTTFDGTVNEALDTILYPYIEPTFSSFSLTGYSTLEVGDEIPTGSQTFTFDATTDVNVQADSIDIENVSDSIVYVTGSANDNTETVNFGSNVIRTTPGSKQFRITGTNTQASTFTRNYNVNWYFKVYYGESAATSLGEGGIEGLRVNLLTSTANRTYAFLGGDYKYMCWSTTLGTKSNFFDVDTGFAVAMEPPVTINITNAFGVSQDYYVYRTTNPLVGAINIQVS